MTISESAISLRDSRSRPHTSDHAETSAAQEVSRSACCTHWPSVRTGCGAPTTTGGPQDEAVLANLLACADEYGLAEVSPMVCDMDDPAAAGVSVAARPGVATARQRAAYRGATEISARDRVAVQRRAVSGGDAGGGRCPRSAAVRPRRRGGGAPPAGALRFAVRHLPERGVSASAGRRRVQADPRRPDAHAIPRRSDQAVLHLPQPRLPAVAARTAQAGAPGVGAVRLVFPGQPPRSGRAAGVDQAATARRAEKFTAPPGEGA